MGVVKNFTHNYLLTPRTSSTLSPGGLYLPMLSLPPVVQHFLANKSDAGLGIG